MSLTALDAIVVTHLDSDHYLELGPRNRRPDGPKAGHALTIKLDHSGGADQRSAACAWGACPSGRPTANAARAAICDNAAAADPAIVDAVRSVAGARGVPMAQVALARVLSRPGVTAPIVGATKLAHVTDAAAARSLDLGDAEVAALDAPYRVLPPPAYLSRDSIVARGRLP